MSPESSRSLIGLVSKEEIKEAVIAIKASSAPGPDGFTGFFFQKYWSIIGEQVVREVLDFFGTWSFPPEWNFTYLFLAT
ncbi:hypothetical protein V5N11_000618 [Cardamine amara subsp. amara]|uniref:RNA-directed DNA polymerase (Reverse transcriptase) n=1 Tax=Cardamine amara subsp. amara TaxID=228776 RepID=A0ABD1B522_CARAN